MSIQHPDVIDGIGLEDDGAKVVMLISDHLSWDDTAHVPLLVAKIEAYASAALSGQLMSSYPLSEGKPISVRLVYHDLPNGEAQLLLSGIGDQLRAVGIGFEHTSLPHDY